MRLLYFIVLFFLSSLVYGQKSVLLQNTNTRAQELKHYLNKTEDSIVFKCDRTIFELMIFNDDFERVIKVKDTIAKIQISDIPVGRYAVEAVLRDKLIIITLLRNESFGLEELTPLITNITHLSGKTLAQPKAIIASTETVPEKFKILARNPVKLDSLYKNEPMGSENDNGKTDLILSGKKANPITKAAKEEIKTPKNTLISNRLPLHKNDDVKSTKPKQPRVRIANNANSTYWVLYKINNGNSSEKILKMADQKTVDHLIRKIEIDMKTTTGRFNELTVWHIYDTTNFVEHKRKNKANYMNIASDSFNLDPYYKTDHNPDKL